MGRYTVVLETAKGRRYCRVWARSGRDATRQAMRDLRAEGIGHAVLVWVY